MSSKSARARNLEAGMLFTKDKNAVDLIVAHMDTTVQCIKTAGRAVESYIEGNLSEAADLALKADALESDPILRRMIYI